MQRRQLLKHGVLLATSAAALPIWSARSSASSLTPLDSSHPPAAALHYVDDHTKASSEHYPQSSGQQCANCRHYQGAGQPRGGCALFNGFSVSRDGWCSGWVAAPE